MMKARMLVESGGRRECHLDALARYLKSGETLVVTVDSYREDAATLHLPLDPAAEIVAVEPPTLQPDGVTEMVAYVVCRGSTRVRRVHIREDGSTEESESEAAALRQGSGAGLASA
ncbi:MAG TPA: hypothetical protein VI997_11515 [Candidatus Thermoplasmatota archaeon]|nr:hypothetical protein [Candidatus Thermoplasmatota archaeon]